MEEIWKVYKETYPANSVGLRTYEVSNFGRVKVNGVIVEPNTDSRGYKSIGCFRVHRAVAELFIPNIDNKPYIDHIDTNTSNNHVGNLRWVTQKENMNNPLTRQHCSDSHKGEKNSFYGKKHSPETRRKISEAAIGRTPWMKGKTHSEEAKRKISESLKRIKSQMMSNDV